jgi:uncharacterized membrane protein
MPKNTTPPTKEVSKPRTPIRKFLPWVLIVCGIIGTLAAGIITHDKLVLASNPDYQPACSLDPILSCGNIMTSWQATAFWDIPNPFIGLIAFPVMIAIGVGMLAGATVKKRWYWLTFNAITFLAVIFTHWLFYQSVYVIGNLCIYCMAVWAIVFISFVYLSLYNIEQGYLSLKQAWWPKFAGFVRRHHIDIIVLWAIIIFGLILQHFWYFYGPKLGF